MKPSMRDIAEAAGVSAGTVSNVFNGRKGVSFDVQQRVLSIAREMGYTREAAANKPRNCIRFVRVRKHGLIIMDTPFFAELMEGIESECHRSGYELIITNINLGEKGDRERIDSVVNDASTPFVLLATELDEEHIRMFAQAKAPMVALDRDSIRMGVHSVTMDNIGAGAMAAELLMSSGHREIGYLGSSHPLLNDTERQMGLEWALNQAGLRLKPHNILRVEPTMEGACRDMLGLLHVRGDALPTAFFCMNDLIAAGANRALKEKGYQLPQRVSLIGMDDMPVCSIIHPPLTSISVDKFEFGAVAVQQLLYTIEHRPKRALCMTAQVIPVIRASIAAAKKGRGE